MMPHNNLESGSIVYSTPDGDFSLLSIYDSQIVGSTFEIIEKSSYIIGMKISKSNEDIFNLNSALEGIICEISKNKMPRRIGEDLIKSAFFQYQ
jgi:hypothetical protein